jgi:hypothetical protein
MRGSEWHRARMTAREFSSAENFANFRQLPVFRARFSQSTKTSTRTLTTGVAVSESPQANNTRLAFLTFRSAVSCLSTMPPKKKNPTKNAPQLASAPNDAMTSTGTSLAIRVRMSVRATSLPWLKSMASERACSRPLSSIAIAVTCSILHAMQSRQSCKR